MTLLNGYRMVIGLEVCPDMLTVTTPLAEQRFPWRQVELKEYWWVFLRTDLYVCGAGWPFMMAHSRETGRAVHAIKQVLSNRYLSP